MLYETSFIQAVGGTVAITGHKNGDKVNAASRARLYLFFKNCDSIQSSINKYNERLLFNRSLFYKPS